VHRGVAASEAVAVTQACSIDLHATPEVQPFLDQLLSQKAAAQRAGFAWHGPGPADGGP
jgi:hypothetical protein